MTESEELELMQMQAQVDQKSPFNRGPQSMPAPQQPGTTPEEFAQGTFHGGTQGLTFGLSDEMAGGLAAATQIPDWLLYTAFGEDLDSPAEVYKQVRNKVRNKVKAAKENTPLLSSVADVVGSLGSGVGAYKMLGKMAPNTMLGSTTFGAGEGALNAAGRGDTWSDVAGDSMLSIPAGAALGATGFAGEELFRRLLRGRDLTPDSRRIQQAEKLDIKLSPAQRFDDPTLHKLEASMRSDPGYSEAFKDMDIGNQTRFNQIAAESIGLKADKLSDRELGQASRNISDLFNTAAKRGENVKLDKAFFDNVSDLEEQYVSGWGKRDKSVPLVEDAKAAVISGNMSVADFQKRYSQLGRDLQTAKNQGNVADMELYGGMRQAISDVLDRNYSGVSSELQEARDLFKNQLILEKPGVINVGSGDVSPLTLANKLKRDTKGYMRGGDQSDLYNLGRVAQGFRSDIGDSGTATRSRDTLLSMLLGVPKKRIGDAYMANKLGTAAFAGPTGKGGSVTNPLINALLQSPELWAELNKEQ